MANYGEFGLSNARLKQDVEEAKRLLNGIGTSAEKNATSMDAAFKRAGQMAAGYFSIAAASNFVNQLVQIRGEFQQLEIAFSTMLKSKEKADSLMKDITQFAATTPFDLKQVAAGTKQLLAYGFAAGDMKENLSMLGNVASGVGSQIGDLIYLYGTLKASGRVTQMDMNQFAGRGIPIYAELAKVLGVNVDQVRSFVSAGKVGFSEIEKAFKGMTNESGMFYNLMQEQSKSLTGQISNLGDAVDSMFNEIGRSSEGILSSGISVVASLVENYETVGKVLVELISIYGTYKVASMVIYVLEQRKIALSAARVASLLAEVAAQELVSASAGLVAISEARLMIAREAGTVSIYKRIAAQLGLNAAVLSNPYAMAAVAIVALGFATWALYDSTTAAEKSQKALNDRIEEQKKLADEERASVEKNISTIKDETSTRTQKQLALKTLQDLYPSIFRDLDIEKVKNMELASAIKLVNEQLEKRMSGSDKADIETINKLLNAPAGELSKTGARTILGDELKGYSSDYTIRLQLEAKRDALIKKQRIEAEASNKAAFNALSVEHQIAAIKEQNIKLTARKNQLDKDGFAGNVEAKSVQFVIKANEDLIASLEASKKEYVNRDIVIKSSNKTLAEAKKALDDFNNDKNPKLTKDEWIKKQNELKETVETAQKAVDSLKSTSKKELSDKKEADKKLEDYKKLQLESEKKAGEDEIAYLRSLIKDKGLLLEFDLQQKLNAIDKEEAAEKLATPKGETFNGIPFAKRREIATNAMLAAKDENNADELKAEKEKLDAMLLEYQSFEEKRKASNLKYTKEREELIKSKTKKGANIQQLDSAIATADQYNAEDNAAIDKAIAEKEIAFRGFVDRITTLGLDELVKALESANAAMQASGATDTEKAILRAKIQALQTQLKSVKTNAGKDSEADVITNAGLAKAKSTVGILQEVNSEIGDIIGNFDSLDESTKTALNAAKNIAGAVFASITGIISLSVVGAEAIKGVERASVILAIIGAAISVITIMISLFDSAAKKRKQAEEEEIARQKQAYLGLLDYNAELRKKYDWIKKNGELTLSYIKRETAELAKQKSENEKAQQDLINKLSGLTYKNGTKKEYVSTWYLPIAQLKDVDNYVSLAGKSFQEIAELSAKGLLSKDAEEYFQALKKAKEEGADIDKMFEEQLLKWQELATGTTKDSIIDSIIEGFKEGKKSAEDFASTFEDLMSGAIQQALREKMDARAEAWYKDFYEKSKDGLTDSEKTSLKSDYDKMIADNERDKNSLESISGVSLSNAVSRTASAKGIATASQDSVDENNGRLTAIQGHTFRLAEGMDVLKTNSSLALQHLAGIENNTSRLKAIEQGISDINTKGIFIKV